MCQALFWGLCIRCRIFSSQESYEASTLIALMLQMRKLRHREVKKLVRDSHSSRHRRWGRTLRCPWGILGSPGLLKDFYLKYLFLLTSHLRSQRSNHFPTLQFVTGRQQQSPALRASSWLPGPAPARCLYMLVSAATLHFMKTNKCAHRIEFKCEWCDHSAPALAIFSLERSRADAEEL